MAHNETHNQPKGNIMPETETNVLDSEETPAVSLKTVLIAAGATIVATGVVLYVRKRIAQKSAEEFETAPEAVVTD